MTNKIKMPEMKYVEIVEPFGKQIRDAIQKAYSEGYTEGYAQGKFDAEMEGQFEKVKRVVEETPQAKRDRIVEQAKKDVEELKKESVKYRLLRTKFVINREKRTVVCLIERFDLGYIAKRGIAKCAPGDCFNSYIGRAIAIRRALGLEVPAEYLNVPNPTEVRVGDKIKWTKNYVIIGINDGTYRFRGERDGWVSSYLNYDRETLVSKIIDDSREEESE